MHPPNYQQFPPLPGTSGRPYREARGYARDAPTREQMGDSERASADEHADDHDVDVAAHLADVDGGAGCIEIWEHLSESRAENGSDASDESASEEE